MKNPQFLRSLGIIPKDEIHNVVSQVKERFGELPDSDMSWIDEHLETSVQKILKNKNGEEAVADLTEDIMQNQCFYLNGWSKYSSKAFIEMLHTICTRDFEGDWIIDTESCTTRIIDLLDVQLVKQDEVLNKIMEDISKEPHIYLIPTAEGVKKVAELLCENIVPNLQKITPKDFTLQIHRVKASIEELIKKRIPMDTVVTELSKKIESDPLYYFCPPSRPSVDYAMM
jgi:hypothetical protein